MENTSDNRLLIARTIIESLTDEEIEQRLEFEICDRYKREPLLFAACAVEYEALEANRRANDIEDEQRGDYVPMPDLEGGES